MFLSNLELFGWEVCKDSAYGVGNSCTHKYEHLLVFCSFLFVSLNVLVSYFIFYRNSYKNQRNLTNTFKLTHRNEQNTSKCSYSSVHTTCTIFTKPYLWPKTRIENYVWFSKKNNWKLNWDWKIGLFYKDSCWEGF
jgi:hypothetical protein